MTAEALDAAERNAFANINTARQNWASMGISFPQVEAAIDARDINQLAAVIIACRTGGDQVDGPTRDKAAILSRPLTDIAIEVNNIWEVNRRRAELSRG